MHTRHTPLRSKAASLLMLVFCASIGLSGSAGALSNVSPDPANMYAIPESGFSSDQGNGGVSHMLKYEKVAIVSSLRLGAYFTTPNQGNNKSMTIEYGQNGEAIKIVCGQINFRNGKNCRNTMVTVTIGSGSDGQGRLVYRIPLKNIEEGKQRVQGENIPNGECGSGAKDCSNNALYSKYRLPAFGNVDPNTGYYYVPIVIQYADTDDFRGLPPGGTNSFNFRVRILPKGNNLLGPLGQANNQSEFGLRSSYFTQQDRRGIWGLRAQTEFGVPCTEEGDANNKRLWLYDADTNIFGDTYLKVTKNGQHLRQYEASDPSRSYSRWTSNNYENIIRTSYGNRGWQSSAIEGSGNRDSFVSVHKLEASRKNADSIAYKFIIENLAQRGKAAPNGNVLSISIPYDAIYATLDCDYSLKPTAAASNTYMTGGTIDVSGQVERETGKAIVGDGATGDGKNHRWEVFAARFMSRPSEAQLSSFSQPDSDDEACERVSNVPGYDRSGGDGCVRIMDNPKFSPNDITGKIHSSARPSWNPAGMSGAGKVFCFFTRVLNPTDAKDDNDKYRYSPLVCSSPGKQPKVQVRGHDLRVGGDIYTGTSSFDNKTYQSWGEYGVFADGCNREGRMTSGAYGFEGSSTSNLINIGAHPLTFANQVSSDVDGSCMGKFGGLPDSANVEAYASGGVPVTTDGRTAVTINGSGYGAGTKRIFYYPNATVTIAGDLRYDDTFTSISRIPRVVIIAKNIVVSSAVDRIDPWLIATEKIGTCNTGNLDEFPALSTSQLLDDDMCTRKLTFNGPVITDKAYLYRTHGSGSAGSADTPAELFNLRPDAFLSSYAGANGRPVATTDAIDELPPRF